MSETLHSRLEKYGIDGLLSAFLSMNTKNEMFSLLEDLCTISELQAICQRYHVAELLHENEVYNHIAEVTGASSATISRVKKCLTYGSDGYKLALERTQDEKETK